MVSTRRRLALLGACIASLLLAAAFLGSSGSASAGPNRAGDRSTSRSDAGVPARPATPSTSGRQQGAPGHARAARTAPENAHFEGAIDNSDPTQTDRLFRSGINSTCAAPTSGAVFGDGAAHHYDLYEVVNNSGSPSCVEVNVGTDVCTGTNFIFSAAYNPTFNPANILENWQADSGSSPDIGIPQIYSFNLAASAHAFINVHEVTAGAGCPHYTVDVNGADPVGGPPPPPPPPPPSFYTITTETGQSITPGVDDTGNHFDDGTTPITLPFPVSIYGQSYTQAVVDSNGTLQFTGDNTTFTNTCLPGSLYGRTFFPYWDDQRTDNFSGTGEGIFTTTTGSAPNRVFYIEWRTEYYDGGGTANYEVVLNENDQVLKTIYGQMDEGNTSSTEGAQDSGTGPVDQYGCNGAGGSIAPAWPWSTRPMVGRHRRLRLRRHHRRESSTTSTTTNP